MNQVFNRLYFQIKTEIRETDDKIRTLSDRVKTLIDAIRKLTNDVKV